MDIDEKSKSEEIKSIVENLDVFYEKNLYNIIIDYLESTMLYCGFSDGSVNFWDLGTKQSFSTPIKSEKVITCMKMYNGKLYIGFTDNIIQIWDVETNKLEHTFTLPMIRNWNNSTKFLSINKKGILVSSSSTNNFYVFNLKTRKYIKTIKSDEYISSSLLMDDNTLYSGHNRVIKKWDLKNSSVIKQFVGHKHEITSLVVSNGLLFSGGSDSVVNIWDIYTQVCLQSLTGVISPIVSMIVCYNGDLWCAKNNGIIEIWKSGILIQRLESENHIRSMILTLNGEVCIGYREGNVRVYNYNNYSFQILPNISDYYLTSICC